MIRRDSIWKWLAFAWLVFMTALNIYRGVTWSLTIDEARVFNDFIATPFRTLFNLYDACYHVLHTWLTRLTVTYLGRAEWVIRLPGLVAGVFYFAAVWKLSNRLLDTGPLRLLAVVVLSANPLILDHLSLARGYGLALTLFTWAFYHLVLAASENETRRITKAGYLLGLSVAANLTFVFPAAGLTLMFAAVWTRRHGWRIGQLIDRLLLPMIVPATLILMIPLTRMPQNAYYYGVNRLLHTWSALFETSFSLPGVYRPDWTIYLQVWVMPVVAVVVLLAAIAAWRKLEGVASHVLVFAAGTIALVLAALVAGHRWRGVPYPLNRTGLFLVWLFLAACLATIGAPLWRGALRFTPWLLALILAAIGGRFVWLTSSPAYQEFLEHSEVKQAVRQLRALQAASPKSARVGGSWEYMNALKYYRMRYRLGWLMPETPEGFKPGLEYYILTAGDVAWIDKLRLRKVWTGPRTGIMVALPIGN